MPFIARYRKEATGTLDDAQLRTLEERLRYLRELEERRAAILESIRSPGQARRRAARRRSWRPTPRPGWRTSTCRTSRSGAPRRRSPARPAWSRWPTRCSADPTLDPQATAAGYVDAEQGRRRRRRRAGRRPGDPGRAVRRGRRPDRRPARADVDARAGWSPRSARARRRPGAKFADYFDFAEPFTKLPSHRILGAVPRREGGGPRPHPGARTPTDRTPGAVDRLRAADRRPRSASPTEGRAGRPVARRHACAGPGAPASWSTSASTCGCGCGRRPRTRRCGVFAANLRDLLLAAPAGTRATMGLDPGLRTGVKVAVVDATGKVVATDTIYPHEPRRAAGTSRSPTLARLAKAHDVELIAIGNGTASRETDKLAADLIARAPGAQADQGRGLRGRRVGLLRLGLRLGRSCPGMDVSLRGAVSIARRLQDPLAELVKIDPKSIGVGQYQHDLAEVEAVPLARRGGRGLRERRRRRRQHRLGAAADAGSPASATALAENIVAHRDANGPFRTRTALKDVPRLGPKAFEQCAGLPAHPRRRRPARRLRRAPRGLPGGAAHPRRDRRATSTTLIGNAPTLRGAASRRSSSTTRSACPTVTDILAELEKPGRDPRPAFKTATFAEGVEKIARPAARAWCWRAWSPTWPRSARSSTSACTRTAWCTSRRCRSTFVKDPRDVVKSGDVVRVKVLDVDIPRKRISLTLRLDDEVTGRRPRWWRTRQEGRPPRPDRSAQPDRSTRSAQPAEPNRGQPNPPSPPTRGRPDR